MTPAKSILPIPKVITFANYIQRVIPLILDPFLYTNFEQPAME